LSGFANCNNNPLDGCEINVSTDPSNCGGCGLICNLPHATSGCANGNCTILACTSGWANCNGIAEDGCEVDVTSDLNNCGACNNVCTGGKTCVNSSCV
jgi:hypothetical protein